MEKEESEGTFSGEPPKEIEKEIEKTPKEIISEYTDKANPKLKEYNKKIVDKDYYDLMKYGLIILLAAVLVFGYMAWNDKLKSEFTCPAQAEIPACPSCPICPTCPENVPCPNCPNISNNCELTCGEIIISE